MRCELCTDKIDIEIDLITVVQVMGFPKVFCGTKCLIQYYRFGKPRR